MTDPLLTIDDARREFRASPKTIRRRLVAGEIEGAYKRPGSRGPEWVMPRAGLVAAGFIQRQAGPTVELPADPEAQAGYWEQRALDAEAALEVARQGLPAAPTPPRRRGAWLAGAAAVVGVVLVLLLTTRGDDGSPAAPVDPAHEAARATLAAATGPDDAIGVVGRVPRTVLPIDRDLVLVDADDLRDPGPRYLVAVATGDGPSSWVRLRDSAEVVARIPVPEGAVELLDVDGRVGAAAATPPAAPEVPATPEAEDDPAAELGDPLVDAGEPSAEPEVPAAGLEEGPPVVPTAGEEITVAAGGSFWSVAVDLASAAGEAPTTAEVTAIWSALVQANLDRLVEPGNPDLLHVGQALVVPALP